MRCEIDKIAIVEGRQRLVVRIGVLGLVVLGVVIVAVVVVVSDRGGGIMGRSGVVSVFGDHGHRVGVVGDRSWSVVSLVNCGQVNKNMGLIVVYIGHSMFTLFSK